MKVTLSGARPRRLSSDAETTSWQLRPSCSGHDGLGAVDDMGAYNGPGAVGGVGVWNALGGMDDHGRSTTPTRRFQFLENQPAPPHHAALPHVFSLHCMLLPGRP
jgi:hypothetical protein